MKKKLLFSIGLLFFGVCSSYGQTTQKVKQYDAWAVYSYKENGKKICYVLSMPVWSKPLSVRHGNNFFLISKVPNKKDQYEPQFQADYPLKENSQVQVKVNKSPKVYNFFIKDSSAWLASSEEEAQLVQLLRSGSMMEVQAVSKKGTQTQYGFSLKGITAALKAASVCK